MINCNKEKIEKLEKIAKTIRREIIEMLARAGSGHTAGSLDMVEILAALYFEILKHNPQNPAWEKRDRLILSHGHTCPALYATLAEAEYFPKTDLRTLRKFGSSLQGHPHREWLKGLETSSGPLGSGLSQAIGMALADRVNKFGGKASKDSGDKYFYCLMSDGEMQCGQTWEALMLAGKEKLTNLIAIIDRNGIQISGQTKKVMPLESLRKKLEAFNWQVLEIDGHNFEQIIEAVGTAKKTAAKPTIIIARTIPGKGFAEFENDYRWHGKAPNTEQVDKILKDKK
ncbi:MAG: transketolase [Candidatus Pacebacteria bacterium]|nr:transketolase [Candidatus Paceibacterota bacterium]